MRQVARHLVVACVFLVNLACAAHKDASWPQFHGPNRGNISTEKDLLKTWPRNGPPLVWTTSGIGHGFSSVAIANNRIYTAGNVGELTAVSALNLDGKTLWQVNNGKAWTGAHPGSRGTPTIDGDRLYHQNPHGNIICLDARTGDILWQCNIIEKFNSKVPRWALSESLLVDGDRLFSCPGGPQTCMVALNKTDGSIIWQAASTREWAGYASPTLFEYKGLLIIITLTSKSFIGVNADTGELLWRIKHETPYDENTMKPIFHNGEVFVSTVVTGSVKWELKVKNDTVSLRKKWHTQQLDNHHGGVILVNKTLYGSSTYFNKNSLVCLDWKTGRVNYMDTCTKVSLTYADGLLYALSIDGVMGLIQPTPTGHKQVSYFKLPKGGKGKSWAHPVVCGGRLYIRHGEFLYAYGLK
jgi:outer membrane protein assembly factor BamB